MPRDMRAMKDGASSRKSTGSYQASVDPYVSEWGNPADSKSVIAK